MATCPQCATFNQDDSRFCIKCGRALDPSAPAAVGPTWPRLFVAHSLQALAGVCVLFLLRAWLSDAPFIVTLTLLDWPLRAHDLVATLAGIGIVLVLLRYIQWINWLWPRAFPTLTGLTPVWIGLVGLGLVATIFGTVEPLLSGSRDLSELLVIVQWVVVVVAIGLSAWVGWAIYRFVPGWFVTVQFNPAPAREPNHDDD